MTRDGAAAARVAHNHEVPGSSPGPATKEKHPTKVGCFSLVGQESVLRLEAYKTNIVSLRFGRVQALAEAYFEN